MWQAKKISSQNRDFIFFLFCPSLHPNNKIHTKTRQVEWRILPWRYFVGPIASQFLSASCLYCIQRECPLLREVEGKAKAIVSLQTFFFTGWSVFVVYVAPILFFSDAWIRTQRAAVASRRAINLPNHLPKNLKGTFNLHPFRVLQPALRVSLTAWGVEVCTVL